MKLKCLSWLSHKVNVLRFLRLHGPCHVILSIHCFLKNEIWSIKMGSLENGVQNMKFQWPGFLRQIKSETFRRASENWTARKILPGVLRSFRRLWRWQILNEKHSAHILKENGTGFFLSKGRNIRLYGKGSCCCIVTGSQLKTEEPWNVSENPRFSVHRSGLDHADCQKIEVLL